MSWKVTVVQYGEMDETRVEAETLGEAVNNALDEMSFAANDEGALTITVEGSA